MGNLKSTLYEDIITAAGGSVDDLPDNLETTYLKRIAESVANAGGGGGESGGGVSLYEHHVALTGVVTHLISGAEIGQLSLYLSVITTSETPFDSCSNLFTNISESTWYNIPIACNGILKYNADNDIGIVCGCKVTNYSSANAYVEFVSVSTKGLDSVMLNDTFAVSDTVRQIC